MNVFSDGVLISVWVVMLRRSHIYIFTNHNKYTYFTHTCIVFPNNCSLSLVAMGDKYEREERIDFWDNVQGKGSSCGNFGQCAG